MSSVLLFLIFCISQGSTATHFRCGGRFCKFIAKSDSERMLNTRVSKTHIRQKRGRKRGQLELCATPTPPFQEQHFRR